MNLATKSPIMVSASSAVKLNGVTPRAVYSDVVHKIISFGSKEYSVLSKAAPSRRMPASELFRMQMIAQVFAIKVSLASKAVESVSTVVRKFQQQ